MKNNTNTRYDYEPFLDYDSTLDYPNLYLNYEEDLVLNSLAFENDGMIEGSHHEVWDENKKSALSMFFEMDYYELTKTGQYFFGCNFDIYKNTYLERYNSFLSIFPDANEIDFCNIELKKKVEYICSESINDKMKFSLTRRNEFLNGKTGLIKIQLNEPDSIDLSNTKAVDKILYLQKLGVIDFLRLKQPFNTSVNSLATVFSAITGEKPETLQPMLNPMLSKKVADKNNPLNSITAVDRVESRLINIGFKLNETI
jgi:hypothetical protein